MAFTSLHAPLATRAGRVAKPNRVSISRYRPNHGGLSLSISRDLVAALGDPKRVQISRGTGRDFGLILISPARMRDEGDTFSLLYQKGKNAACRIGLSPRRIGVATGEHPAQELSARLTDDGLVVDIEPLMPTKATASEAVSIRSADSANGVRAVI